MRSRGPVGQHHRRAVAIWIGILGFVMVVASIAFAGPSGPRKVTICHATASAKNGYVTITVDAASIIGGGHGRSGVNEGDIIPPFDGYPGHNWDGAHQAIFNSGCGSLPTTATASSTSTTLPAETTTTSTTLPAETTTTSTTLPTETTTTSTTLPTETTTLP